MTKSFKKLKVAIENKEFGRFDSEHGYTNKKLDLALIDALESDFKLNTKQARILIKMAYKFSSANYPNMALYFETVEELAIGFVKMDKLK